MARKYDRMIRFYGSWFADLNDPEKQLTPEEKWQVIEAIVACQNQECTEPLLQLPLTIRRALSMATMREQLERVLERNQGARERGQKGAQERYSRQNDTNTPPSLFDALNVDLTPPGDGKERNWEGLRQNLEEWQLPYNLIERLAKFSNFGEIGNPIWKAISMIQQRHIKDKAAYITKCLDQLGA